jgi:5-methyltetrahydrofolate--homocysteine methyltransferase
MTELIDTSPAINVDPAEYRRLLGYPRDHEMSDRAQELVAATQEWYRQHGHPWIYLRPADRLEVRNEAICIDGMPFTSRRLSAMLTQAEAHGAFLVAVSAGPEAEEEAHRRWLDEKPDEYFFLETYASAVVEHLITAAGARLCAWADGEEMAILPHYSPGYSQWDIAEQSQLLRLVESRTALPGRLETLDSGALRPKKSQLAVFGLTRHAERTQLLAGLVPCQNCPMANCQFRRVPYKRLPSPANYSVNLKALARWAAERLSLQTRADGAIEARFRYDGTTCTNMGRALKFQYDVILGPPQDGYPDSRAALRARPRRHRPYRHVPISDRRRAFDGRHRSRKAAARPAAGERARLEARREPGRLLSAKPPAANINGGWCSKPFTTLYTNMDKNGKPRILDALADRPLLGDGAMGTQLMLAGLEQGNCGEAWNLTHPEKVLAIQQRYAEAGSDCILTNTFGGSRIMLNRHSHAEHVVEINQAGVRIAREAFGGRPGFVIGDIGPFGGLLEPYGDFTEEQVRNAFNEQAGALVDAGADAIIVETQTSLEELLLGIHAAKEAGAPCIIGSMAYDVTLDGSTFRTMMGIDPERAAEFMQENGVDIVALNCGTRMDMERARTAVERYRKDHRPAGDGAAQCRPAQTGEHESGLRRDAGADGDRGSAAARCRRQHYRRMLRQHAGAYPRVPPGDGRIFARQGKNP